MSAILWRIRRRGERPAIYGRHRERARLRELLDDAIAGHGSLVLISGEAGIGKTSLVQLLCEAAMSHEALVLIGHAYERSTPPAYGPWIEVIRDCLNVEDVPVSEAPLLAGTAQQIEDQTALFQQVLDFLTFMVDRCPALLILEDLHWSDAASLDLLRFVARSISSVPLLLVVTYRVDEVGPGHHLYRLLPMLIREADPARFELRPLDNSAVRVLVEAQFALHPAEARRLVAYLVEHSEGNPLYMRELLRTLGEDGTLASNNGEWLLGDLERVVVPTLIDQLIGARLARLGPDAHDLLTVASILGQDVPHDLWREMSDVPEDLLESVIALALGAHILQESPDGEGYRFSHALVRQALYSDLLMTKRRDWHRRAGEVLEASYRPDPSMVAHHYQLAGDRRAAGWQIQAAENARMLHAPESAIEHYRLALEMPEALSTIDQIRAHRGRGRAHDTAGNYIEAQEDHEVALKLAQDEGALKDEWQALMDLGLVWAPRDYDQAGRYWQQALELARAVDDPAVLARSLNRVGNWHGNIEEPFEAVRCHEEALSIFEEIGDRRGLAETRDFLGMATMLSADLPASVDHYRRAVMLLEETGNRQLLASSLANLQGTSAAAMNMSSRPGLTLPEGERAATRAVRVAHDISWPSGETFALVHLGTNLSAQGQYGKAQRTLRRGLEIAEEIAHHQWESIALWTLGASYLDFLADDEARACLERSHSLARHIGSRFMARCASCFLALACIRQGALDEADQMLANELDFDTDLPTIAQRMQWSAYLELALARDRFDEVVELVDWLNSLSPAAPRGYVPINLMLLRGRALIGLSRLQDAEADLAAARAGAIAQGAGSWLHAIHRAFLELYQRQGRSRDVERELRAGRANIENRAATIEDQRLREQYRHRASRQLEQLVDQPSTDLTPRELQVLQLVAQGLTDAEIATRLGISTRTVNAHAHALFGKLDVTGRTAATRVAIERGII